MCHLFIKYAGNFKTSMISSYYKVIPRFLTIALSFEKMLGKLISVSASSCSFKKLNVFIRANTVLNYVISFFLVLNVKITKFPNLEALIKN